MKILMNESSMQNRSNMSANYVIGDIIKRNYGIHKQIMNYKYFSRLKHEKTLIEL
jgi:hypothetical protein